MQDCGGNGRGTRAVRPNKTETSASLARWSSGRQLATALTLLTMVCGASGGLHASEPEPQRATAYNWTGLYIGGHVGTGIANMDGISDSGEQDVPGDDEDSAFPKYFDLDDTIAGIHIGYNKSYGRFVFGVEADWSRYSASDQVFDADIDGGSLATTDNIEVDISSIASLRGRIGISSARSLLYLTAGVAWLNGEYQAHDADQGEDNTSGTSDINSIGFAFGGGLEHALANNITVRLEGLYYSFDEKRDTSRLTTDSDAGDFVVIDDIITARLGVSYRLGQRSQYPAPVQNALVWRGFYAGGHGGYGDVNFDSMFDAGALLTDTPSPEGTVQGRFMDLNGEVTGVHAGFNFTRGRFLFGAEFDWTALNKTEFLYEEDGSDSTADFPGNSGSDAAVVTLDSLASIRARVGFISARTLFFATAGIAWVDGEYTVHNFDTGDSEEYDGAAKVDLSAQGFVFGAGMEHALTDNLWLRIEGLHYSFDDRQATDSLTDDSDAGDFAELKDITVYRLGVSYKFDFGRHSIPTSFK